MTFGWPSDPTLNTKKNESAVMGPALPQGPRNFASACMMVCEMCVSPPPALSANATTISDEIAITDPWNTSVKIPARMPPATEYARMTAVPIQIPAASDVPKMASITMPSASRWRSACMSMPLPQQRQQQTQGGSKHEQNIHRHPKTQHLPDRYRPHRSEPQGWRYPLGEALGTSALHRPPLPAQFPYRQALSRHQCRSEEHTSELQSR